MGNAGSATGPPVMDGREAIKEPVAKESPVDKSAVKETGTNESTNQSTEKSADARAFASVSDQTTCSFAHHPFVRNTSHLNKPVLAAWLGVCTRNLDRLAMSGPVLKYLRAAHAVLTFPDSNQNPDQPGDGETETCLYAIGILFRNNVRSQLPTNLRAITTHHRIPDITAEVLQNVPRIHRDPKRRGQILASIVIALFQDLLVAQAMRPQDYDPAFRPYITQLELANPWRAEAYKCRIVPYDAIYWPNWNPRKSPHHPCQLHQGAHAFCEHAVETYHRILSLLRYSLREHEPARYYGPGGLGHDLRHVTDVQFVHDRVAALQAEMREAGLAERARERKEGREPAGDQNVRDLAARHPRDPALQILTWFVDNEDWHEQIWGRKAGGGKRGDSVKGSNN